MADSNLPAWQLFWAKTDRDGTLGKGPDWTRPLWMHLLDVTAAAEALIVFAPAALRQSLGRALGLNEPDAVRVLSLLAGLHDAGKAIPSFQFAEPDAPYITRLRDRGLALSSRHADARLHHGHASIPIVVRWLRSRPEAEPALCLYEHLAGFAGFHHGRVCPRQEWERPRKTNALGDSDWQRAQDDLVAAVAEAYLGPGGWPAPVSTPVSEICPPELVAFAGWVTLSDWVGSLAERMPDADQFEGQADPLPAYLAEARAKAREALAPSATGLALGAAFRPLNFQDSFPDLFDGEPGRAPRPVQALAASLPLPDEPALVVVEAPTGEGKTEAAFHLAARLQRRRHDAGLPARGVYVAMPTQATSNGLFPRFETFLQHAHDAKRTGGDANLRLVHGADALNLDQQRLLDAPGALTDVDPADGEARVRALRWFSPKKRALLAPYGVGTVDQALLGALLARHFFLRLYGLAGKTVVFDEVHAYDGYMAGVIVRLVQWLRALGADVVVLSATLPTATRDRLLEAWGSTAVEENRVAYPALTLAAGGQRPTVEPFEADPERRARLAVEVTDADLGAVADQIAAAVRERAVVLVVLNLVRRAQGLYDRLSERADSLGLGPDDLVLLHARFPFSERQARESHVVGRRESGAWVPGRFGKGRPDGPAVLVATQVAEQSLDLDADLLISDLAPVDLLLQRSGRLHRHRRHRPEGYESPRLVVLAPGGPCSDLPPTREVGGGSVYLDLPMLRTARLLRGASAETPAVWELPADYRDLVEAVYPESDDTIPDDVADQERWKAAVKKAREVQSSVGNEARIRTIPRPEHLSELVVSSDLADRAEKHEDDGTLHADRRPLTRLGTPSVEVVCLHLGADGRLYLDATGRQRLAPAFGAALGHDDAAGLLGNAVRLGRRGLANAILDAEAAVLGWAETARRTPALFHHRPLVFDGGVCVSLPPSVATLDPKLNAVHLDPDLGVVYLGREGRRL